MGNFETNFDLLVKGGPLMVPIVILSIYTFTVIIMKVIQFNIVRPLKTGYVTQVIALIKAGDLATAKKTIASQKGPIARVMEVTIKLIEDDHLSKERMESEIERVGATEMRQLESHLRGLEMSGNVSPLLGLLGTVMGMVQAFAKLAESGSHVDPSLLAGGIWEALITTVGGLMVAVPAVTAYYLIDNYIEKIRGAMRDGATQVLLLEKQILAIK
jgi:biopolymer transport protein ExbB